MMFFFQFIQMRNSPSIKYLCFQIICLGARVHVLQYYTRTSVLLCISDHASPSLPGLKEFLLLDCNYGKVESEDKINAINEQSALFCFRWYYFYYTCIICISSIFSFKSTENNAGFITFFLSCNGSENKSIYSPFFIL